jgi:hypothetical protein
MAVTLAQAKLNTQDDLVPAIIDEFRKQSAILDAMPFDQAVNPMGGGSTLTYGYHRLVTERGAEFREINTEYTDAQAEKARYSVDLVPLGGSYSIDRVLAQVARGAEVAFQVSQVIKGTVAKFTDALINGDTDDSGSADQHGFDGLDKALSGTTTELNAAGTGVDGVTWDWSNLDTGYHAALDSIDYAASVLDGPPSLIIGNQAAIAKFRAIARRANQYVERPVDDLVSGSGGPVVRGYYGNALLVDAGAKPGSASPIIPTTAGVTDLYFVRLGLDGYHGVAVSGQELLRQWAPDFSTAGAVKRGEVEMGPVAPVLKATKAAAVVRNVTLTSAS